MTIAITAAVLAFIGFRLAGAARHSLGQGRLLTAEIVRGIRWRHVWPVPLVLTLVIVVATALLFVPGLDWGWWTALGGEGNPVLGSTDQTAGTFLDWMVPGVFLTLLLPAVPVLALREEETFRLGAETWSGRRRAGMAVVFGLAHAVIGVPIGVALALSVGGAYFIWRYLRGLRASGGSQRAAVLESARAHTVYNWTILGLIVVLFATGSV